MKVVGHLASLRSTQNITSEFDLVPLRDPDNNKKKFIATFCKKEKQNNGLTHFYNFKKLAKYFGVPRV